jgi:hypothetical protein
MSAEAGWVVRREIRCLHKPFVAVGSVLDRLLWRWFRNRCLLASGSHGFEVLPPRRL